MVARMTSDMRSPSKLSPPLPPDPTPAANPSSPKVQAFQEPFVGTQQQSTNPTTPPRQQPQQQDLKRAGSTRAGAEATAAQVRASSILQQPQPIKDAVNNAFEQSSPTNQLDPDFIKQVTEQVIRNLQAAGATPTAQPQQSQTQYTAPPLPQQTQQQPPQSPTRSSTDSRRYTPPTPDHDRRQGTRRYESSSPEPSSDASTFSRKSKESARSNESRRLSRDTPRPPKTDAASRARRSTTATENERPRASDDERTSRVGSDGATRDRTPYRRDSKDSEGSYADDSRSRVRASEPEAPVVDEPTVLEQRWQPLFDNGNPTMRLSQFLRGLALHLIDDYEPRYSLVVTPPKMLRFLNETKLQEEHYPWDVIFSGKMTPGSISTMYRKLLCQHHLVQTQNHEIPGVPGLTTHGFEWFMTCLIQAHPSTEFERLSKAVLNMPISNADDKSERFPKELPRRLLPAENNIQAEQRLVSSLNHEPYLIGNLKGSSSMPPPPPSAPPSSFSERERKPYSQSSQQSNAVDDDDLGTTSVRIERERKPYTAKEGAGKNYASDDSGTRPPPSGQFKPEPQANTRQPARQNSGIGPQAMYSGNSGPSEPLNIPSRNVHRASTSQAVPQPTNGGGYPKPARRSPPPPRTAFGRNDGFEVGSMPGSMPNSQQNSQQYNSSQYNASSQAPYPTDDNEETLRRFRSRSRAERPATTSGQQPPEDDSNGRGYPIPGRSGVPIGNGYEYGRGTAGGPAGGPPQQSAGGPPAPVGSFPSRQRPPLGVPTDDDRRRSMYASPPLGPNSGGGDGGTDGYGSFNGSSQNGGYPPQQSYGSSVQH